MRKYKFTILLISLFIVGCNNSNKESTTTGSTSFVEESSTTSESSSTQEIVESIDVIPNADLNVINKKTGLTPSVGDIDILLIPIHFKDISDSKLDTNTIEKAFNSENDDDVEWYSVKEFYKLSSYGKCNLNFKMTDVFTPSHESSYYTTAYNNSNYVYASDSIVEEALQAFDSKYDYSEFDSNGDGYIDGVYLIYDHPVDYDYKYNLWWAYTYYHDNEEITFDNMHIKSYVFAGFDFLKQDDSNCNTHTIIHETAHLFGVDDYYDYDPNRGATKGGLAGGDIMDGTIGDHNAFTKSLLGWNKGTYVFPTTSMTINLSNFQENGDYIILANDFNEKSNILQEYFILEYYTPTKLNEYDKPFTVPGVRMLHVLATTKSDGSLRYNNTDTNAKLLSQITNSNGATYISSTTNRSDDTLFIENENFVNVKYATDNSNLNYSFVVDKLTDNSATITITNKLHK